MRRAEFLSARCILSLVMMVGLVGCGGGGDPNKGINVKPTVRVTGKVLVDGAPPETAVAVTAHLTSGTGGDQPLSSGGTGNEGVFELTTYNRGDGLPVGEYKLTFLWMELRLGGGALQTPNGDKLGGQYSDPKTSQFTVKVVESDDVQDIGVFELKKAENATPIKDDRD